MSLPSPKQIRAGGKAGPFLLAWLAVAGAWAGSETAEAVTAEATLNGAPAAALPAAVAMVDEPTLVRQGASIGAILIRNGNVFDTEREDENNFVFRAANKIHVRTRKQVIRRLLLFERGDPFDPDVLRESERLLRGMPFLFDASIRPFRLYDDNTVDIEVRTRDVWTLQVGFGFSRSGGREETRIGVEDTNFLGTGKAILVRRTDLIDRDEQIFRYRDPNLLGSRVFLEARFADNSDGGAERLAVRRPFFSLASRWSAGMEAADDRRIEPLYDRGEIFARFRQRTEHVSGFFGLSEGRRRRTTRRYLVGFVYEDRVFETLQGEPTVQPADQTFAYPWVGFQWIHDRFIRARQLDRLQRTEDLNLGHELNATLGRGTTAMGSDLDRTLWSVDYRYGSSPGDGQIVLLRARGSGRYEEGEGRNVTLGAQVRYFVRDFGRHQLFFSVAGDYASRLDGQNQLLLGGDTGLRGYPIRFLRGDRRLLITVEQRFYTDWHLARLAHIGAAVFFDAGDAWFADGGGFSLKKDVGLGLRVGSSRSASAAMVHIDVAFPLDGDASIDDVQFLVTTKETF
ncbi:hypothetical protein ABI59_05110 [Acidobacteria bacterium Mor1]|nr:hypothetical protein ABI59_05110 [Acidobacteria bacterium Mor1]